MTVWVAARSPPTSGRVLNRGLESKSSSVCQSEPGLVLNLVLSFTRFGGRGGFEWGWYGRGCGSRCFGRDGAFGKPHFLKERTELGIGLILGRGQKPESLLNHLPVGRLISDVRQQERGVLGWI